MQWRYHYPQAAFPCDRLVTENARRTRHEPDFELLDTGIVDDRRYRQITADYAKAATDDGRLVALYLPDEAGPRPAFGGDPRFGADGWKDQLLFFEYFDADTGEGLGASHQTGWTGLIADSILRRHGVGEPS
jgi:hypothetical protein